MKLRAEALEDLSLGAVFLATGGGGDPYTSYLLAKEVLTERGGVELIDPQAVADDAFVVTLGAVGAPTVSLELLPSRDEAAATLSAYEEHVGRKADAIVSFEIGGGNSLLPLIAGAELGIPVIDGDGMGRALPEAQMMTYPISGVKPTPALGRDYAGGTQTFATDSIMEYEAEIRRYALENGGMIVAVEHPMSGAELKASVVPNTVSFSVTLGKLLRERRGNAERMGVHLSRLFDDSIYGGFFHLYSGKVADYSSRIVGGYDIGEAVLESFDRNTPPLTISIKNEYLLARLGDRVIASVPDLITLVDYETSTPINAERLRFGQRVSAFGIGCPACYRQPEALAVVAPRCFGFDIDYEPIEGLAKG
ncbi:MAG: DUF917 domain-containing protein [Pseudomonadota bacterium]